MEPEIGLGAKPIVLKLMLFDQNDMQQPLYSPLHQPRSRHNRLLREVEKGPRVD